jgi:hypothetical protein
MEVGFFQQSTVIQMTKKFQNVHQWNLSWACLPNLSNDGSVFHDQSVVTQLDKNVPSFYGNHISITMLIKAHHWTSVQTNSHLHNEM